MDLQCYTPQNVVDFTNHFNGNSLCTMDDLLNYELNIHTQKMKAQLEHLAHYLPYQLKAKFRATNKLYCRDYVIGTINVLYCDATISCYDTVNSSPNHFKPILKPLALYRDINSPAMVALNCDLPHQMEIQELAHRFIGVNSLTVGAYLVCLQAHIDVFGLIDAGVAIDVNKV